MNIGDAEKIRTEGRKKSRRKMLRIYLCKEYDKEDRKNIEDAGRMQIKDTIKRDSTQ